MKENGLGMIFKQTPCQKSHFSGSPSSSPRGLTKGVLRLGHPSIIAIAPT